MNILFMGDLHGGHDNVVKYRPAFQTCREMWDHMKGRYNAKVGKRDHVYYMGDTAFSLEYLEDLKTWNGKKKTLILGNHDTERLSIKDIVAANVFDEIHGMMKFKEFWLSHAPIHPDELRGKCNIHGHTHGFSIDDPRYVNVCPEVTAWAPISLHDIRCMLKDRYQDDPESFSDVNAFEPKEHENE